MRCGWSWLISMSWCGPKEMEIVNGIAREMMLHSSALRFNDTKAFRHMARIDLSTRIVFVRNLNRKKWMDSSFYFLFDCESVMHHNDRQLQRSQLISWWQFDFIIKFDGFSANSLHFHFRNLFSGVAAAWGLNFRHRDGMFCRNCSLYWTNLVNWH